MKRQRRSSSPTPPTPHPAIKSLKKSIALLATLDLPEPQFNALLESLTAVHEDLTAGPGDDMEGDDAGRVARVPVPRPNNWDWSAVIGAGRLERTILEDFRAGKELMDTVGITVRPLSEDGRMIDLLKWEVAIPGPVGTDWEGGLYKMTVTFPPEYFGKMSKCRTSPPLFHPNVYPSGTAFTYLGLLHSDSLEIPKSGDFTRVPLNCHWGETADPADPNLLQNAEPRFRLSKLFGGFRAIMAYPENDSPAQLDAYTLYKSHQKAYIDKIR